MAKPRGTSLKQRHLQVVGGTEPPTPAEVAPAHSEEPAGHGDDQYTAEDAAELESILEPILDMFTEGIAKAKWPLDAELHASGVLGILEDGIAGAVEENPLEGQDAGIDPFDVLLSQLVGYAEFQRTPAALAVLRSLAVFMADEFRAVVDAAADRIAASGVKDPVWAKTIGRPAVERCWRYGDIFGAQESYHVVFAYGRRRHALAILIDHLLGGGIKDSWVSDDPDYLWTAARRDAANNSEAILEELTWSEARAAIREAADLEPCPVEPDQVEDVSRHAHLVGLRLSLPADDDGAPASPSGAGRRAPAVDGVPGKPTAKRTRRPKEILQLKVTLKGSKPPIWRRLEVPSTITLDRLHEVIQLAFEWTDSHLHAFETASGDYGVPNPEWGLDFRSERGVRLTKVAAVGEKLTYIYDFGDNWEHAILVEKIAPSQEGVAYPRCTGGRRAAPPEDCGGIWGYQDILDEEPDAAYFSAAEVTEALEDLAH